MKDADLGPMVKRGLLAFVGVWLVIIAIAMGAAYFLAK